MMQHPFEVLRPEIEHLLATAEITRPKQVAAAADEVERRLDTYLATSKATGIPALWIGPVDYRESDCDPRTGIGQGDPWNRASVHVPRGCGPFASKAAADVFYLHHDHIDDLCGSPVWTLPYATYGDEKWNGFGPRAHGRLSGYPWAGTQHYDLPPRGKGRGGKYVSDGVWNPDAEDEQVGTVAVYLELVRRHPDLAIGPRVIPVVAPPLVVPAPVPPGFDGGEHGVIWLQSALNHIRVDTAPSILPLDVDGNYGRRTREAVRRYQAARGLTADGLAGPITDAAIEEELVRLGADHG